MSHPRCSTSEDNGQLPPFRIFLPRASTADISPTRPLVWVHLVELPAPEWQTTGEATAWFQSLRSAVRSLVHRFGSNVEGAQRIFESLQKTHYKDYENLRTVLKNVLAWWEAFSSEGEMTVELLQSQSILRTEITKSTRHMRSPRKAPTQWSKRMQSIRAETEVFVGEADEICEIMQTAAAKLHSMQGEDAMLSAASRTASPLFKTEGEGFQELKDNISCQATANTLVLNAKWEAPLAMSLDPSVQSFENILTISGNKVDAQAATVGNYLRDNFKLGGLLLEGLQESWNSGKEVCLDNGNLTVQSQEMVRVTVSGCMANLTDLAGAFGWFCSAVRPPSSSPMDLSTFKFELETYQAEKGLDLKVDFELKWIEAAGGHMCWHDLFKTTVIVFNAPVKSQNEIASPRGLEIPFDMMTAIAGINFAFEYSRGLLFKGFRTMLIATGMWASENGTAIQYHYVYDAEGTDLNKYVEDGLSHYWEINQAPDLEKARHSRAFIGWADSHKLLLAEVDADSIITTSAADAGPYLTTKTITATLGFSKIMSGTLGATVEVLGSKITFEHEAEFNELIIRSSVSPALVYSPRDERGWLIPKLPVMEAMVKMYMKAYGGTDKQPTQGISLPRTRDILLKHILSSSLRDLIDPEKAENSIEMTFSLRELFLIAAQTLESAEFECRYQQTLSPMRAIGSESLYGFDFFKIGMRDKDHTIKKCRLVHSNWVSLIIEARVKAIFFCDTLNDVVKAHSCDSCEILPCKKQYLGAVVRCLLYLRKHGHLPQDFGSKTNQKAFEKSNDCKSFDRHLQRPKDKGSNADDLANHEDGVVVLGPRSE